MCSSEKYNFHEAAINLMADINMMTDGSLWPKIICLAHHREFALIKPAFLSSILKKFTWREQIVVFGWSLTVS